MLVKFLFGKNKELRVDPHCPLWHEGSWVTWNSDFLKILSDSNIPQLRRKFIFKLENKFLINKIIKDI